MIYRMGQSPDTAKARGPRKNPNLTKGQRRVLDALVKTESIPGAAELLGLSAKTISAQIQHAKKKLGVHTLVGLALAWDRLGREYGKTTEEQHAG